MAVQGQMHQWHLWELAWKLAGAPLYYIKITNGMEIRMEIMEIGMEFSMEISIM